MTRLEFSSHEATVHKAVVVSFDLVGFSDFCNQPETSIVAPKLVKLVFDLLNERICSRDVTFFRRKDWPAELCATDPDMLVEPFLIKFTGDGAMLFWICSVEKDLPQEFCDLVVTTMRNFQSTLALRLPACEKEWRIHSLPKRARVGIATGFVYAIRPPHTVTGWTEPCDFVGYCINLAIRLQNHCPELGFLVHGNMHPGLVGMESFKAIKMKGTQSEPVVVFSDDVSSVSPTEFNLKFKPLRN